MILKELRADEFQPAALDTHLLNTGADDDVVNSVQEPDGSHVFMISMQFLQECHGVRPVEVPELAAAMPILAQSFDPRRIPVGVSPSQLWLFFRKVGGGAILDFWLASRQAIPVQEMANVSNNALDILP